MGYSAGHRKLRESSSPWVFSQALVSLLAFDFFSEELTAWSWERTWCHGQYALHPPTDIGDFGARMPHVVPITVDKSITQRMDEWDGRH